jgi:hypothetical protein
MKYAVEMDSGAKFNTDWFRHSKVKGGGLDTDTQHGYGISLLLFFQRKESRRKITSLMNINLYHISKYQHLVKYNRHARI